MWTRTLVQVSERYGSRRLDFDTLRPFLQSGFRWHDPDREHPVCTPDQWWAELTSRFEEAFAAGGCDAEEARRLAAHVRPVYCDVKEWSLFEDTLETLLHFRKQGWRQAILSNHVPELASLTEGLGLKTFIDVVVNSAETGFEKPHPNAYRTVLTALGGPEEAYMIGDNVIADVLGAEAAGLRGILVRSDDPRASRRAATLRAVRAFLP